MDASPPLLDFSLVNGGLLFGVERRLHLIRPPRVDRTRLMLTVVVLAWLPLLVLVLPQGGAALRAFRSDLHVHAQLLASMPVLVLAEPYVDAHLGVAVSHFLASALVGTGSRPAFEEAVRSAMRWRDKWLVEVCLLVAAFSFAFVVPPAPAQSWVFAREGEALSPAGWWYLAVSQPLLLFLELRWVWRAMLWAGFLFRVSRLRLSLLPSHPDMMGGLGFLPICQSSFAPVVFAVALSLATHLWMTLPGGIVSEPIAYGTPIVVFGVLALLAVFAPLGLFTPHLVRTKRRGDSDFSVLASRHSRLFEQKWMRPESSSDELLGAPEISSLTDLASSFALARRMRLFPYERRSVVGVAIAVLLPLVFLLLMDRAFLAVLLQLRELLL